jgi:hypothetical protein
MVAHLDRGIIVLLIENDFISTSSFSRTPAFV